MLFNDIVKTVFNKKQNFNSNHDTENIFSKKCDVTHTYIIGLLYDVPLIALIKQDIIFDVKNIEICN